MNPDTFDLSGKLQIFGELLARQRKKRGIKQKDLANACQISQRAQSTYENGTVAPKVDYLFKLQSLGYDVHRLIAEDSLYELTSTEQTIMDLYRASSPQVQMAVLEILAAQAIRPTQNITNNTNQASIAGVQSNQTTNIKK